MGLTDWALKAHYKKLRDSQLGKSLARGFEELGYNDGTHASIQRATDLYNDFYETIEPNYFVPRQTARDFASNTTNSRYPILFNVALDYALNFFSKEDLLEVYRDDKAQVVELSAYVDAIYPEFLKSRPRSAANFNDVHIYQAQMWALVVGVATYLKKRDGSM